MTRASLLLLAAAACDGPRYHLDISERPDGIKMIATFEDGELRSSHGPWVVENGARVMGVSLDMPLGQAAPYLFEFAPEVLEHPSGPVALESLALVPADEPTEASATGSLLRVVMALDEAKPQVHALHEDGSSSEVSLAETPAGLARTVETEPCASPLGAPTPLFPDTPELFDGYGGRHWQDDPRAVLEVGDDVLVVGQSRILLVTEEGLPPTEPNPRLLSYQTPGLENLSIRRVVDARPDDGILVVDHEIIYRLHVEGGALSLEQLAKAEGGSLSDLAPGPDGRWWLSSFLGGVFEALALPGPWTDISPTQSLSGPHSSSVLASSGDQLALGLGPDAMIRRNGAWTRIPMDAAGPLFVIRSMEWASDGRLWMGGLNGEIYIWDGTRLRAGPRLPVRMAGCAGEGVDLEHLNVALPVSDLTEVAGFMVAVTARCTGLAAWRVADGCAALVRSDLEAPAPSRYIRGRLFPFRGGWVLGERGGALTYLPLR